MAASTLLLVGACTPAAETGRATTDRPAGSADDKPSADRADPLTRQYSASYRVKVDAARTWKFEVAGWYRLRAEKTQAPAGKTDIFITYGGKYTATNLSQDRAISDDMSHDLEVFVPAAGCVFLTDTRGPHCATEVLTVEGLADAKSPGAADSINLASKTDKYATIPEGTEDAFMQRVLREGVVVATERFPPGGTASLNPTCRPGDLNWVTYWSEKASINTCSTEP